MFCRFAGCNLWSGREAGRTRTWKFGKYAMKITQAFTFEAALPTTFVPGRNILFMTLAAALAYRRGVRHLATSVCKTDYSSYPDCRDDTLTALQVALNLGMERCFVVHTPPMWIDKASTWTMAERLGGVGLVDLVRRETHSCYAGDRTARESGAGCGACPACDLRAVGWARYAASEKIRDEDRVPAPLEGRTEA